MLRCCVFSIRLFSELDKLTVLIVDDTDYKAGAYEGPQLPIELVNMKAEVEVKW